MFWHESRKKKQRPKKNQRINLWIFLWFGCFFSVGFSLALVILLHSSVKWDFFRIVVCASSNVFLATNSVINLGQCDTSLEIQPPISVFALFFFHIKQKRAYTPTEQWKEHSMDSIKVYAFDVVDVQENGRDWEAVRSSKVMATNKQNLCCQQVASSLCTHSSSNRTVLH